MKVLAATSQTQGWRDNDFSWTVEDELVSFVPIECSRGTVDDDCGCRRSMAGLASHCATTTIKVVERTDLNSESYFILIANGLQSLGYVTDELMAKRDVADWVHDLTDELVDLAAVFPLGTVLERRGDVMVPRTRRNLGVTSKMSR